MLPVQIDVCFEFLCCMTKKLCLRRWLNFSKYDDIVVLDYINLLNYNIMHTNAKKNQMYIKYMIPINNYCITCVIESLVDLINTLKKSLALIYHYYYHFLLIVKQSLSQVGNIFIQCIGVNANAIFIRQRHTTRFFLYLSLFSFKFR